MLFHRQKGVEQSVKITPRAIEIECIAHELHALGKWPLPATQEQVQALVKLAERDRPLTVQVDGQAVVKLLLGKSNTKPNSSKAELTAWLSC